MADSEYRFRLSLARKEETWRLNDEALECAAGGREWRLPFAEIRTIRIYRSPGLGVFAPTFARCVIRPRRGKAVVLSSNHFAGLGRFEDRLSSFRPFVEALTRRVAAANPGAELVAGMPPGLWWTWAVVLALAAIVTPLAAVMIVVDLTSGRGFNPALLVVMAILLTLFFGLSGYVRTLRRGRPRRFDPQTESPLGDL